MTTRKRAPVLHRSVHVTSGCLCTETAFRCARLRFRMSLARLRAWQRRATGAERVCRRLRAGLAELADWTAAKCGGSAPDIPAAIEVPHEPYPQNLEAVGSVAVAWFLDQLFDILRAPAIAVAPGTAEAAVAHIRSASERLCPVHRQLADAKREIARVIDILADSEDSGSGQPGPSHDVTVLSFLPRVGQTVLAHAARRARSAGRAGKLDV